MGTTNIGGQQITFSYQEQASSDIFNTLNYRLLPKGIYQGGFLSKGNDTTARIAPFVALFEDSTTGVAVRIESTQNADIGGAASLTPFLVSSFTWASTSLNYADFSWKSLAEIVIDDVIFGKANFSGEVLDGTFDYSDRDDVFLTSSGGGIATVTSDYTISGRNDSRMFNVITGVPDVTVTLPDGAGMIPGDTFRMTKTDSGAGDAILAAAGTDTINGATSVSRAVQYGFVEIMWMGNGLWITTALL